MPHPAPGALVGRADDQQACDVLDVRPGVRGVKVGRHERAPALAQRRGDQHPEQRVAAEVVAAADLERAHAASLVCGQRIGPHLVAHAALLADRGQRRRFGHGSVDRAVAVQVARGREDRPGRLGRGQQRRCNRRPGTVPIGVRGVDAVVDRDRPGGQLAQATRVGRIGGDLVRAVETAAAARDDADVLTAGEQFARDRVADRTGADDHV